MLVVPGVCSELVLMFETLEVVNKGDYAGSFGVQRIEVCCTPAGVIFP